MKLGKVFLGVVITVVIIAAIVVFLAIKNINELVKVAVETTGPQVTKTPVTLQEVNIELTQGRGQLSGLTVGNPSGFSSQHALQFGDIVLHIDTDTVTDPVLVIKEIKIAGTRLIAEQKDLVNSNLQELAKNIQSAGQSGSGSQTEISQNSGSDKDAPRFMVEKLTFSDASLQLITQEWGEKTLNIPSINLTGIGDKEQGLTADQLAQALLDPIIEQAKKAAGDELKKEIRKEAEEKLKEKLKEKVNEKLGDDVENKLDSLKDKLSEKDKEKLDALKGLLNR